MSAEAVTPNLPSTQVSAPSTSGASADGDAFTTLLGAAIDDAPATPAATDQSAQPVTAPLAATPLALQLVDEAAPTTAPAAQETVIAAAAPTPQIDPSTEEQPEAAPPTPPQITPPAPKIVQPGAKTQAQKESDAEDIPDDQSATAPDASAIIVQAVQIATTQTPAQTPADSGEQVAVVEAAPQPTQKPAAPKQAGAPQAPLSDEPVDGDEAGAPQAAPKGANAIAAAAKATSGQAGSNDTGANANSNADSGAAPISADASLAAGQVAPRPAGAAQTGAAAPHASLASAPNAVAHEIVRRFDGKSTSFQLRLDPAELGRVDIRIDVSHDKKVTATISADNPLTLKELAASSRELQRALSDAGLDLADNGLSFSDRRDSAQTAQAEPALRGRTSQPEDQPIAPNPARPFGVERWGGARVDVWV